MREVCHFEMGHTCVQQVVAQGRTDIPLSFYFHHHANFTRDEMVAGLRPHPFFCRQFYGQGFPCMSCPFHYESEAQERERAKVFLEAEADAGHLCVGDVLL